LLAVHAAVQNVGTRGVGAWHWVDDGQLSAAVHCA
jgi:hypothetical protein